MCDAEYEWAAELLEEGEERGRAKGRAEGRAEGEAKGRSEGRAEGILLTARNMIAHDQKDSFIATITGLPIAEVQALRAEMPR